jgi:hypothetical protein
MMGAPVVPLTLCCRGLEHTMQNTAVQASRPKGQKCFFQNVSSWAVFGPDYDPKSEFSQPNLSI